MTVVSLFRAKAHEAYKRRQAGASLEVLEKFTGWERSSLESILSRVRRGQLPPQAQNPTKWSRDMDLLLKKHWKTARVDAIAFVLSGETGQTVTKDAVTSRARRLGLPPRKRRET
jgi:transposase